MQLYPRPVTEQDVILEFRSLDSNTLHPYYRLFIQKYATACSREILGEIRSKYSVLPSPGGGAQLNGELLIEKAMKEKEQLKEQLMYDIQDPAVFTMY